jgi:hypothetical protein
MAGTIRSPQIPNIGETLLTQTLDPHTGTIDMVQGSHTRVRGENT